MKSSSNSKSDVDFVMRRRFVSRMSSVRCFMFVVIADIVCHSVTVSHLTQTSLSCPEMSSSQNVSLSIFLDYPGTRQGQAVLTTLGMT